MKRYTEQDANSITITDIPEADEALRGGTLRFQREQDGQVTVTACDMAHEQRTLEREQWERVVEKMNP